MVQVVQVVRKDRVVRKVHKDRVVQGSPGRPERPDSADSARRPGSPDSPDTTPSSVATVVGCVSASVRVRWSACQCAASLPLRWQLGAWLLHCLGNLSAASLPRCRTADSRSARRSPVGAAPHIATKRRSTLGAAA